MFNINNVNNRTSIPVFLLLTLNKKMLAEINFIASSLEWWHIKQQFLVVLFRYKSFLTEFFVDYKWL